MIVKFPCLPKGLYTTLTLFISLEFASHSNRSCTYFVHWSFKQPIAMFVFLLALPKELEGAHTGILANAKVRKLNIFYWLVRF
jgi:hypothetical protein